MSDICKFYKEEKEVSYDGGTTWIHTGEYRKGDLVEFESTSCAKWIAMYPNGERQIGICTQDGVLRRGEISLSGLTSVEIGDCVISIGDSAFRGCDSLTSATIGNNVTIMGNGVFSECSGLTSIVIPDSVISMGDGVFSECSGLTDVTIGSGITYIPISTFFHCENLETITIPNNINRIGEYAFGVCGLTGITIPNSVTRIDTNAFFGSENLEEVIIPNSVTYIGTNAFQKCKSLIYCSLPTNYSNPVNISDFLFDRCENLETIIIPGSVDVIGKYAFQLCTSLTEIRIPNSVDLIDEGAFYRCSGLTKVNFTYGLRTIEKYAFWDCVNLGPHIYLPNTLTSIGEWSFYNCKSITEVSIPSGVTSIGNGAFDSCTGLSYIFVDATTPPTLGNGVFDYTNNCQILVPCESIVLYLSTPGWINYADRIKPMQPCEGDYRVTSGTPYCDGYDKKIDTSVQVSYDSGETWTTTATTIMVVEANSEDCGYVYGKWKATYSGGTTVSADCDSTSAITQNEIPYTDSGNTIETLKIGFCVTSIGSSAFTNYLELKNINIPSGVTSIGVEAFSNCIGLSSLTIPDSVTSIGNRAFQGCFFESINISNSITAINEGTFNGCIYLTSINIPSGVTSIGNWAFNNCSSLSSITVNAITPPTLGYGAFDYTNNCPILVPCYAVDTYKSSWSDYASRIQGIEPCGEPQYRTISGETYCSGNTGCDKYVDVYSQVSYDSGTTWITTATTATLIEEKSADCGYRERTTSSSTYCNGSDLYENVYSQVSYDSGTTWITTATTPTLIESGSSACYNEYTNQYLTFVAQDNGTFTFNGTSGGDIVNDTIYYSLDSGSTWSTLASGTTSPTINSGNKIMWKGELQSYGGIGTFSSTGRYSVEGNAMSLLYGDNFIGQTTIESTGALEYLFQGSTGLTSVENMVLPATSLQRACYFGMFSGCTALTTAMEILPCTGRIRQSAYANMFYGCTSLTRAPELPGKLGDKNAYNRMFYGCSSLNYIKCLTTSVPSNDYGYPYCTGGWVEGVAATGTFVKNASTTWPTGTKWVNGSIPDGWTVIDA